MKQIKALALLTISTFSFADKYVTHISPDEGVCSIEEGFKQLSSGMVELTDGDMHSQREGFADLLNGISALLANGVNRSGLSMGERKDLCDRVNYANEHVLSLVDNIVKRSDIQTRGAAERTTMVEGLKQIVAGLFSILMNPSTMKMYLATIFSGVMKLLSAIFADGKVDKQDLADLQGALADILSGKSARTIADDEAVFF